MDNGRDNVITIAADSNDDGFYESITELVNSINQGINNDLELAGTVQAIVTSDNEIRFRTSSPSDFLKIAVVTNGDQTTVSDLGFSSTQTADGVGEGGLNLSTLESTNQFRLKLNDDAAQVVSVTPKVYSDVEALVAGLNAAINSNSALSGEVQAFVDFSQGAAAIGFSTTRPAANLQMLRGTQPLPSGGIDIFDAVGFDDANELVLDTIPGNESNYNNISTNGNATSSVSLAAFTLTQEGRDAGNHIASISVFDSFGETHNMIVSYEKATQELPAQQQKLISTSSPMVISSQDPNAGPNDIQPVDSALVESRITDLWSVDNSDPENPGQG